jgi:hypothetical protein
MRETKSLTRAQARAFCRSVVVTLMVTRPDGSVAMFLAVNEMKGQHDRKVTPAASPRCHLSRSKGSVWMGVEMLRCTQHDRAVYKYFCLDL